MWALTGSGFPDTKSPPLTARAAGCDKIFCDEFFAVAAADKGLEAEKMVGTEMQL